MAKMSEQEHIFYILRGIPRNNEWNVFLEVMVDNNPMTPARPDEIISQSRRKGSCN
jgi:hypothetical protein